MRDRGGGGLNIVQIYVTSFMNAPLGTKLYLGTSRISCYRRIQLRSEQRTSLISEWYRTLLLLNGLLIEKFVIQAMA